MTSARNLIVFVVVISAAFVYICKAIPQVKSEPVALETEIGDSPDELVAAGNRIFASDRAQCLTCHSLGEDPKARCPNQEGLGERAATRKGGTTAAEYLVESVYDPNAFVVSGYPAKQMTPVNKPPIALSHDEILAVLCYLNSMGGVTDAEFVEALRTAQNPWRKGLLTPGTGVQEVRLPILPGDVGRGSEQYQEQGCVRCHRIGEEGQEVGPELTAIGASQTADYLLESLLDASAVIVKGYKQTIVFWKDDSREVLRGTAVAWLPNKDHPVTLQLAVQEEEEEEWDWDEEEEAADEAVDEAAAQPVEPAAPVKPAVRALAETIIKEIDLSEVAAIGDTIVGVRSGNGIAPLCAEYVSGNVEEGVKVRVFENGGWLEREVAAEQIGFVNLPMSPMPANFAELVNPREAYDLVAFLLTQKGEQQ